MSFESLTEWKEKDEGGEVGRKSSIVKGRSRIVLIWCRCGYEGS